MTVELFDKDDTSDDEFLGRWALPILLEFDLESKLLSSHIFIINIYQYTILILTYFPFTIYIYNHRQMHGTACFDNLVTVVCVWLFAWRFGTMFLACTYLSINYRCVRVVICIREALCWIPNAGSQSLESRREWRSSLSKRSLNLLLFFPLTPVSVGGFGLMQRVGGGERNPGAGSRFRGLGLGSRLSGRPKWWLSGQVGAEN